MLLGRSLVCTQILTKISAWVWHFLSQKFYAGLLYSCIYNISKKQSWLSSKLIVFRCYNDIWVKLGTDKVSAIGIVCFIAYQRSLLRIRSKINRLIVASFDACYTQWLHATEKTMLLNLPQCYLDKLWTQAYYNIMPRSKAGNK